MKKRLIAVLAVVALLLAAMPFCAVSAETQTLNFYQMQGYYKTQGRVSLNGTALEMDTSSSGFEFYFYGSGDVVLTAQVDCTYTSNLFFTLIVDGVRQRMEVENGVISSFVDRSLTLASGLSMGYHHIEFYKQNEMSSGLVTAQALTFSGTLQATPPLDALTIEVVGDSISGGSSSLWTTSDPSAQADWPIYQDGTQTYAYVTGEALGANVRVTQTSGYGLVGGWNSDGVTLRDMFPYTSWWRSNEVLYDFSPSADIVIINLGTNDYGVRDRYGITDEVFRDAAVELMTTAREKNPNCQVVWCTGMMGVRFSDAVQQALSLMGGEEAGFYYCELPLGSSGGGAHPNIAEQRAAGEVLTQFLLDNCLPADYQASFTDQEGLLQTLTQAKAVSAPSNALQTAIQAAEMELACNTTDAYRLGVRRDALLEAMNGTVTAIDLLPQQTSTQCPSVDGQWVWPYYGNTDGSVTLYKGGEGYYWPYVQTDYVARTVNLDDTPYLNIELANSAQFNLVLIYLDQNGDRQTLLLSQAAGCGTDDFEAGSKRTMCIDVGSYMKQQGLTDANGNITLTGCTIYVVGEQDSFLQLFRCALTDNGAYGAPTAITSSCYTVADGVIAGIAVGTTAEELKAATDESAYVSVLDGDQESSGVLKTGMTLRLTVNGTVVEELTVAVTGDVNGDGVMNATDGRSILMLVLYGYGSAAQRVAADINGDGELSTLDVRVLLHWLVS